jgi:hypothetical protein
MRDRNTHLSQSPDAGGSGLSTKRTAKQMVRRTTSRGKHRGTEQRQLQPATFGQPQQRVTAPAARDQIRITIQRNRICE